MCQIWLKFGQTLSFKNIVFQMKFIHRSIDLKKLITID